MSVRWKIALALVLASVALVVFLFLAVRPLQRSFFYPKAKSLPPIVAQSTPELLIHLEKVLATNAPTILATLQPGLTDTEISALESKGAFKLSDDLRALYRWRNGTTNTVTLLPGQRFVPLDEIVQERALMEADLQNNNSLQSAVFNTFAGHRKTWLCILADGAGDGYFHDPQRPQTPIFYHMAEAGYYVWFPSIRNFLAAVIESYESDAIKTSPEGKIAEDFDRVDKILQKYGAATAE